MTLWQTYVSKIAEYFSRKFILSSVSLGTGFWLVLQDKPVLEYAGLVGVVLAFYNGANVVETVAAMRGGSLRTKIVKEPSVEVNVDTGT